MVESECCGGETSESAGPEPMAPVPVTSLRRGQCGIVQGTSLEDGEAAMLRAMGLRPRVRVRVCRLGEPCIVEVCCGPGVGSRIALNRPLAERVLVRPVDPVKK